MLLARVCTSMLHRGEWTGSIRALVENLVIEKVLSEAQYKALTVRRRQIFKMLNLINFRTPGAASTGLDIDGV